MLTSSVFVGILIGLLRRGSMLKLASLRARLWWLLLLAFLAKFIAVKLHGAGIQDMSGLMLYVQAGVYFVSILFIVLNRHLPWMKLILVGTLSNAAVVMLNGGRMPVSEDALVVLGKLQRVEELRQGQDAMHSLVGEDTIAPFLGDGILVQSPINTIVSIGDVLVMVGVILLIGAVMTSADYIVKSRPIRHSNGL